MRLLFFKRAKRTFEAARDFYHLGLMNESEMCDAVDKARRLVGLPAMDEARRLQMSEALREVRNGEQ